MKAFTDIFIKRPVLAMVVSFVIVIAGAKALLPIIFPNLSGLGGLNVRQYPRSDIAAITVSTVYVGADAELVRGFITTPLERAIAAADGIDYIQSQSKQGQSLITARLKLNYDANKALSDISSKVDAIRRDLPPESEIPVIAIQAADSQFASAYLSFTSDILQPNEVTDYLVRLVQPRLTAVGGVQKADICHAHLDEAGSHGSAERKPGASAQCAFAKQFSFGGGQHERFAASSQPDGEHRSAHGGRFQKARRA